MTTNATLNPNTVTERGFPSVLEQIGQLDPDHDIELLFDIAHCVGIRLNEWTYSFDKVEQAILDRAITAGFEPDGLRCHIELALIDGFTEYRDK